MQVYLKVIIFSRKIIIIGYFWYELRLP